MKAAYALIASMMLSACASEGDKAAERFDMVKAESGSSAELCAAASDAERAYLQDRNAEKYHEWTLTASIYCTNARLQQLN